MILVENAGVPEVNGIYNFVQIFNESGFYGRTGTFQNKPVNYTLYKCSVQGGNYQWFLSITPAGSMPGTTQDVDFYSAQLMNNSNINYLPPKNWMTINNSRINVGQAPTVTITIPNQINQNITVNSNISVNNNNGNVYDSDSDIENSHRNIYYYPDNDNDNNIPNANVSIVHPTQSNNRANNYQNHDLSSLDSVDHDDYENNIEMYDNDSSENNDNDLLDVDDDVNNLNLNRNNNHAR